MPRVVGDAASKVMRDVYGDEKPFNFTNDHEFIRAGWVLEEEMAYDLHKGPVGSDWQWRLRFALRDRGVGAWRPWLGDDRVFAVRKDAMFVLREIQELARIFWCGGRDRSAFKKWRSGE